MNTATMANPQPLIHKKTTPAQKDRGSIYIILYGITKP